ncbi:MAG: 2-amino-4-hydroxy-6-hydroxymethyldihydropteridine diphosphokinase [Candidatus Krumholzibacteria bacterium]|nr:2-amino-4-hydroxy-6-hydroxymethyldihydropteridine diphosphokinase [Candidatus Krumholzibacteria bacterium]
MRRPAASIIVPLPEVVYLGLGTNLGDRVDHLKQALFALATHPEIEVTAVSRVYETEYVGPGSQDPYLNACVQLRTRLKPRVLLAVLKGTEQRQGRQKDGHMQPRPIDLDILMYGQRVMIGPGLTLPHRQMRDRAFVMEPLAELASHERFPDSGETIASACAKIRRKSGPWIKALVDVDLGNSLPDNNKEGWRAALAVHSR